MWGRSRITASVALAAMVLGIATLSTQPAQAVPADACDNIDGRTGTGSSWSVPPVAFQAGETLSVTWSDLTTPSTNISLVLGDFTVFDSRNGAGTVSYTFPSDLTAQAGSVLASGTGNYVVRCGVAQVGQVESGVPAPVGQGVGLPASGLCTDVNESTLDFAADIKGGWVKSWEPWANPKGPEGDKWGWACIRSLVYTPTGWVPAEL